MVSGRGRGRSNSVSGCDKGVGQKVSGYSTTVGENLPPSLPPSLPTYLLEEEVVRQMVEHHGTSGINGVRLRQ